MAIANALSHARQPPPALITTPCQFWSRRSYPLPYYSVLLLIHYFTLWPWPLTLNICSISLNHKRRLLLLLLLLWRDVIKLCTEFERNRAIHDGVITISVFDFMTLNFALRVALGSRIIFTKFDLRQRIRAWLLAFFLTLIRYVEVRNMTKLMQGIYPHRRL